MTDAQLKSLAGEEAKKQSQQLKGDCPATKVARNDRSKIKLELIFIK